MQRRNASEETTGEPDGNVHSVGDVVDGGRIGDAVKAVSAGPTARRTATGGGGPRPPTAAAAISASGNHGGHQRKSHPLDVANVGAPGDHANHLAVLMRYRNESFRNRSTVVRY